jgi:hypothetical protein
LEFALAFDHLWAAAGTKCLSEKFLNQMNHL